MSALVAAGILVVGCTGDSADDSSDADGPAVTAAPVEAAAPAATGEAADTLDVGELTIETTATGFSASAQDGDPCASSQWHLAGPVEYDQQAAVPDGCWGGAHAFDTTWYLLTLPPGDYALTLELRRGAATGSTTTEFSITGS